MREDALALLLGDVEEGEVLGAELARDEVGEVADLRRDPSECPLPGLAPVRAADIPKEEVVGVCCVRDGEPNIEPFA